MKKIIMILAIGMALTVRPAMGQETPATAEPPPIETIERPVNPPPQNAPVPGPDLSPPPAEPPLNSGELRLNFRNAPLDMVLNYLSEAAGYTIILETPVQGTVDVWSNHPVPQNEAVEILDAALARNGYTAIREGRTLTVVSRDAAKNRNIPIVASADWETIPNNQLIATYIVPVRYINVETLLGTLEPLIPEKMLISANRDSNSLIITDAQAAIRRIAQITSMLDSSVSSVSTVRIIPLKHADAAELAKTITDLYANSGGASGDRNRRGFPGFRGRDRD